MFGSVKQRRWAGGVALAIAVTMVLLDDPLLGNRPRLLPMTFYWATCLLLVAFSAGMALLDLRTTALKGMQAHRELFEETVKDIQGKSTAQSTKSKPERNGKP